MSLKFKIANKNILVNIMYIKGIVHLQLPVPVDLQSVFFFVCFLPYYGSQWRPATEGEQSL